MNKRNKVFYIFLFGALLVVILVLVIGGGTRDGGGGANQVTHEIPLTSPTPSDSSATTPYPTVTSPVIDRSVPEPVYQQVEFTLENNDIPALYAELSPSLRDFFTLDSLLTSEEEIVSGLGEILEVEVVEPISIRSESGFDGEWADATVRVRRSSGEELYLVRLQLENGEWWLFGTSKIEP